MKFSQAEKGRVFIIRLEHGEILHEEIEKFALAHKIETAMLTAVGGVNKNSKLIVGPEKGDTTPVVPMEHILDNPHEVTGTGTIFPDENQNPILHMHIACGRRSSTITGCVRKGVKVWNVMEIMLIELVGTQAKRVVDSKTGFKLLEP